MLWQKKELGVKVLWLF
nr:hypothetical protein [Helicobacter pylori]